MGAVEKVWVVGQAEEKTGYKCLCFVGWFGTLSQELMQVRLIYGAYLKPHAQS